MVNKLFCKRDTKLIDILSIFEKAYSNQLPSNLALVVDEDSKLIGSITEGDIRRSLLKNNELSTPAERIMEENPIVFNERMTTEEVLESLPEELSKRNRRSRKYLSKIIFVDDNNVPTKVIAYHQLWELKVASHRHIVVIGLGYVGLTMAVVMADSGFLVTGVEIDSTKIEMLNRGESYVQEVGINDLIKKQIGKNFRVSESIPEDGDVFIISVGTPIKVSDSGSKLPIMEYLEDTCNKVGRKLKRGNLVVLRSTVPIGTSRNFVKSKLEEISGLKCGIDFQLSFAPERTAEGKALKELCSLPQIIGGFDKDSVNATAAIFRDITPVIVKVDTLEAAEMIKLINNSFRDYVFAYANQMAIIASEFNINVVDVINAANKDYPRDPVPLPSPGVGGPCLTKDPHIFASVTDMFDIDGQIFKHSREINESMHDLVAKNVIDQLKKLGKNPKESKILICGLAFKGNPETGDIRNSSSIEIAELMKGSVDSVYGYDAVALKEEVEEYGVVFLELEKAFKGKDAVLFLNNHRSFETMNIYKYIHQMNEKPIIYDGWNLFREKDILSIRECTYMGLSFVKNSIR
ncbi:nucleotide sugar dehydrogenase [Pseudotenacibaculum sp. MALMAid0570]|uniref:nucleotide sugar dehydrogenase n=1 Tax=Pseudotenacibaculum sp. MALMAid0570 TaxID=3143938 RepID=UPI0032DF8997